MGIRGVTELVGEDAATPVIYARLDRACKYSNGAFTALSLINMVVEKRAALFVIDDCIAVLDAPIYAQGQVIRILAIEGSNIEKAFPIIDEVIKDLGKKLKAVSVVANGRLGWKHIAKQHGYTMTHATYFKEL